MLFIELVDILVDRQTSVGIDIAHHANAKIPRVDDSCGSFGGRIIIVKFVLPIVSGQRHSHDTASLQTKRITLCNGPQWNRAASQ